MHAEELPKKELNSTGVLIAWLCGLAAFIILEWQYGGIRFTYAPFNSAFELLFFCIPWLIVVVLLCAELKATRIIGMILAAGLLLLYCIASLGLIFVIGYALDAMFTGKDPLKQPIGFVEISHSRIYKYLSDPGAMGSDYQNAPKGFALQGGDERRDRVRGQSGVCCC